MKKVLVAALAVALAAFMAIPASAFENEFGGYWRVRAFSYTDFTGDDSGAANYQAVDSRTRLYYTAKFSDDLKFVNKFEFDTTWGDNNGGDIGSDGTGIFKIKNSYVDFNIGEVYNFKIGSQGATIGRGFVFDDDFSGVVITGTYGDIEVPFYFIKIEEGGVGKDMDDSDLSAFSVAPVFKSGDMTINPYIFYVNQKATETHVFDLGVDFDMSMSNRTVWATLIYQGGSFEMGTKDYDVSAFLAALGVEGNFDSVSIHGQAFYASGDDKADDKIKNFQDLGGQAYSWSEIMGEGTFDIEISNGSCGPQVSNIMAFNLGASISPMDKVTLGADLWYASLVEGDDKDLGTELDLSASYEVMENLQLDVIAAYLFAGDATGKEDPFELGLQLSLSF
ncbi:MAG: hypothetical protein CSB21_03415 [Deltaproteobacteria bacterium]|nr:MAG: hypothetical protein CSB21_03415 [Deltaproteobacteria bacterium]